MPKHAFNMWVSNHNRLPTRQRLASWGVIPTDACCLCSNMPESRDHLLLTCDFASAIWSQIFVRLTPSHRQLLSWAELLSWTRQSSTAAPSLLRKVTAQAAVYHIWHQRNNLLHNNLTIHPSAIFRIIDRQFATPSLEGDIRSVGDR